MVATGIAGGEQRPDFLLATPLGKESWLQPMAAGTVQRRPRSLATLLGKESWLQLCSPGRAGWSWWICNPSGEGTMFATDGKPYASSSRVPLQPLWERNRVCSNFGGGVRLVPHCNPFGEESVLVISATTNAFALTGGKPRPSQFACPSPVLPRSKVILRTRHPLDHFRSTHPHRGGRPGTASARCAHAPNRSRTPGPGHREHRQALFLCHAFDHCDGFLSGHARESRPVNPALRRLGLHAVPAAQEHPCLRTSPGSRLWPPNRYWGSATKRSPVSTATTPSRAFRVYLRSASYRHGSSRDRVFPAPAAPTRPHAPAARPPAPPGYSARDLPSPPPGGSAWPARPRGPVRCPGWP